MEKANRIDAYRNEATGEVGPRHRLGTTDAGEDLYQAVEGWEPVAEDEDGAYVPTEDLMCDSDGNWYVGESEATPARTSFPLSKIERDNFDGRLVTRLSFACPELSCEHLLDANGRVHADDLYGGPAGTITAPAGSTLGELGDGETVLVLPDGSTLGAHDAYRAARESDRARSFGLGWSPHQPEGAD